MIESRYVNINPQYELKEQQIYFHLMEEFLKHKRKPEFTLYEFAEYIYEERMKLLEVNAMSTDVNAIAFRIARLVNNREFMLSTNINLLENIGDPFSSIVVTPESPQYHSPRVMHKKFIPPINDEPDIKPKK